ncbi:hypothetical protein DL240_02250 [Lujinxingia litoralis]|uniref:Uncharacterized protein n=1 Tax=Lujinxingia litoralis TaxID=2211119 RepID=A0A328CBM1_9DELT|nr:hypothetical protein [Lujinxingia litoralis]RAL25056.1 hypothetical protein DL240_02250 [Lujinxingia litoralis]
MLRSHPWYIPGLMLAAGALSAPGCGPEPRANQALTGQEQAQVTVYNRTHEVVQLQLQRVSSELAVDCAFVREAPQRFLREEHLTPPGTDRLYSGQELRLYTYGSQLNPNRGCNLNVARVDDARIEDVVISWSPGLPFKSFFPDVDAPADVPTGPHTVVLSADYSQTSPDQMRPWRDRPCNGELSTCSEEEQRQALTLPAGAEYSWEVEGTEPTVRPWGQSTSITEMPSGSESDQGSCSTGITRQELSWSTPPTAGAWQVVEVAHDADTTCAQVSLSNDQAQEQTWSVCGSNRLISRLTPASDLNPVILQFFFELGSSGTPNMVNYENLSVDIRREDLEGNPLEVETIDLVRGRQVPSHLGLEIEPRLSEGCPALRESESCLHVSAPLSLEITTSTGPLILIPGETVAPANASPRRLELVRGLHRAVVDTACDGMQSQLDPPPLGPYLELVYYSGVTTLNP